MSREELEKKVRGVLVGALDLDATNLNGEISVDTTEAWDSLGHLDVIECLEKTFGISIEHDVSLTLLGDREIVDYLSDKT